MAAAEPVRRSFSARDGLRLSALEWPGPPEGERRLPLLCLPGLARTSLDFVEIGARYAGSRRVVALDYAGHGESERAADPGRYRVEVALRDVLDAMAALHLHRVVLLGTSFGGIVAMSLGVLRPGCLAAVAMNDIGPRLESAGLEVVREVIGRDPAFAELDEAAAYLRRLLPRLATDEAGWCSIADKTYARGEDGRLHPRWDIRIVEALGRAIRARRSSGRSSPRWRTSRCCCSGGRRASCSPPRRWRGCGRCGPTWRWRGCRASAMRRGWWSLWRSRRWTASSRRSRDAGQGGGDARRHRAGAAGAGHLGLGLHAAAGLARTARLPRHRRAAAARRVLGGAAAGARGRGAGPGLGGGGRGRGAVARAVRHPGGGAVALGGALLRAVPLLRYPEARPGRLGRSAEGVLLGHGRRPDGGRDGGGRDLLLRALLPEGAG